eukprot:XP_011682374.1 PREDICTED: uncharacterized protein LOC105446800 [Strongylocentrotus purpuratus]
MTSEQDNGNTIGKQDHHQKRPDEAALQQPRPEQQPDPGQQPGPAQLQVGPPEHAPPVGPYPNQGQAIADQPQGMMPPDFNQGFLQDRTHLRDTQGITTRDIRKRFRRNRKPTRQATTRKIRK